MTVMEVLVGMTIMVIAAGAISFLVGAAAQSKMTAVVRMAETETARESLEWMSDRLRNAGFNLKPSVQTQARCWDRVVAQDSLLYPTANAAYVSGEFLDVVGSTPGANDITLGYYLGADPVTGTTVIMEYNQTCAVGATSIAANSKPLSNPTVKVTGLTFSYYNSAGTTISGSGLTTTATIRTIKIIKIVMTVQTSQGKSGTQTQTLTRYVLLRDPEPNAANLGAGWLDINENY